jgi:hypothetical protein
MRHLEDNLHAHPVPQANTAQGPPVLPVRRVDIKQRPLEQRPAPSVHLVPQGLPIRPAHAPLLRIECARHVVYVPLEHGEVLPAQSQQIRAAPRV